MGDVSEHTRVWQIAIALADADPVKREPVYGDVSECTLCDASPPGATRVMTVGQHRPDCPWRMAVELKAKVMS